MLLEERCYLGLTDLEISPLVLGGSVFGWTIDEGQSFAVMDAYAEAGGNMIDTADLYGDGESERIIGRWLRSRGMAGSMLIATKVGALPGGKMDLSARHIFDAADRSRERLGIEAIDLYQAHVDDEQTDIVETLAAFGELRNDREVRWVGCSNYRSERLAAISKRMGDWALTRYESVQLRHNLIVSDLDEQAMRCVEAAGLGVLAYAPLAAGFLTGKYAPGRAPAGPRADEVRPYMTPHGWGVLAWVQDRAAGAGLMTAQFALRWVVSRPLVTAAVVSATTPYQLAELIGGRR